MNEIDRLLAKFPESKQIFRFINVDAAQSQISAGIKYKTPLNNRTRVRFTYYSGILVLKGHGTYISVDGETIPVGPGDFFQRFPMEVHSTTVDPGEPWAEVYLDLPAALFSALSMCSMVDNHRHVFHPGIDVNWVKDAMQLVEELETCETMMLPSIQARIVTLLERLLSMDRMASVTNVDKRMETAREMLAAVGEWRSVEEIAEHMNMGYENFRKLFKQYYGVSPNRYRIEQRIFQAQDFLMGTNTVSEAAALLGYCDEFSFSKQFRKYTGLSPREYIQLKDKEIRNEQGERIE